MNSKEVTYEPFQFELNKETIRELTDDETAFVVGGLSQTGCTNLHITAACDTSAGTCSKRTLCV